MASAGAERSGAAALPWRAIVRWALVGTVAMVAIVGFQVGISRGGLVGLVDPGQSGPAAQVLHRDFRATRFGRGVGLDGQQYYAIARDFPHLRAISQSLERPRYRLQRVLFPMLAWALHPYGGGPGLILAFVAVGVFALLLGGVATGALAVRLGGSPVLAGIFALLPGAYLSLRYTLACALALALTVAAITASARGHRRSAVLLAVLAVLAKETALVVFIGWALAKRTPDRVRLVAVPFCVAAIWATVLRLTVPAGHAPNNELGLPFAGLVHAATRIWAHGYEPFGLVCTLGALTLAIAALRRHGTHHPLSGPLLAYLGFVILMGSNVVGTDFGAPRAMMPVHLLAILMLCTPAVSTGISQDQDQAILRSQTAPSNAPGK
jgi:hypothetical protein